MKNVKKLLISVFALSALMLGACSGNGGGQSSSTPASSSSTQPTTTSTEPEPTPSSSDAEDSSEEEESSAEEESSSEEGPIEHAVTLNEAPTAGRVVVVHGWNDLGGVLDVAAEVEGDVVKFDLMPDDDLTGYLIAELKEGKVFDDFVFFDEDDPTKLDHDWNVVDRQTSDCLMSATAATWTTYRVEFAQDESFTAQYGTRTVALNSWINESSEGAGDGASKFSIVSDGSALLLVGADAYEIVVLKAEHTEYTDWDTDVDVEGAKKWTLPESKVTAYYVNGTVQPANDSETIDTQTAAITFVVTNDVGEGYGVFLAGDFNGWAVKTDWRLSYNTTTSRWEGTFDIGKGAIQYKFVKAAYADATGAKWEAGDNHTYTVAEDATLDPATVTFQS